MEHPGVGSLVPALELLDERGHDLHLAYEAVKSVESNRELEALAEQCPRITFGKLPAMGTSGWVPLASWLRRSIDYLRYLDPRYPEATKLRTRAALLAAAGELVAQGKAPTLAEVADAAMVSRATVYRYFPTQDALLVELPLDVAAPTAATLFSGDAPSDPEDRVARVQNALYDLARDHETEFRLFMRESLLRSVGERDTTRDPFRGARRLNLLDEALAPLVGELPDAELELLRTAISMLTGVESMVVLRDVLGLNHDAARAAGEWAVRTMVRAVRQPTPDATAPSTD
jgi:AcrR family transcriptional regulator